MSHKTLVAYASRAGSTAEVAHTVGDVLRQAGIDADVRSVDDVPDLADYDSLILGSAIWAGKPIPETLQFMTRHRDEIARIPVAYFVLCEILRNFTPSNRQIALGYVAPLRQIKEPVSIATFAGRRDLSTTHPIVRWLLLHLLPIAEGDWRDWDRIRDWAEAVGEKLVLADTAAPDREEREVVEALAS